MPQGQTPDGQNSQAPSGMGGGFGGSGQVTQGDAATTISEDGTYSDETYTSTGDDENALRIDGASVTLDGITVDKSAGATSNPEDGDFYGMNAALLATDGAQVTFTASAQTLEGDIAVDSISTLDMTLADGSDYTGTINITENEQTQTDISDNAAVTIDEGCTWTLTGDCTLTSLTNNGTINYNGYTITLADGTVLS